jgi:hypothetical protein
VAEGHRQRAVNREICGSENQNLPLINTDDTESEKANSWRCHTSFVGYRSIDRLKSYKLRAKS